MAGAVGISNPLFPCQRIIKSAHNGQAGFQNPGVQFFGVNFGDLIQIFSRPFQQTAHGIIKPNAQCLKAAHAAVIDHAGSRADINLSVSLIQTKADQFTHAIGRRTHDFTGNRTAFRFPLPQKPGRLDHHGILLQHTILHLGHFSPVIPCQGMSSAPLQDGKQSIYGSFIPVSQRNLTHFTIPEKFSGLFFQNIRHHLSRKGILEGIRSEYNLHKLSAPPNSVPRPYPLTILPQIQYQPA